MGIGYNVYINQPRRTFMTTFNPHVLAPIFPKYQVVSKEQAQKMAEVFRTMPKTMEQDELGDDAIAYLHYRTVDNKNHWYITEKDEGTTQTQAFGLVSLQVGFGTELGYVSLVELCDIYGVELDLDYKPQTLAEIEAQFKK